MFHLEGDTIRVAFSFEIHEDEPTRSYRFITDEPADVGIVASENGVWRLCSLRGLGASHARKKGKGGKSSPPVHDDLLAVVDEKSRPTHDSTAAAPNQKWLTAITEHPTGEGKLTPLEFEMIYATADAA